MILIIGGYAQGKRAYVLRTYVLSPAQIADGGTCAFALPENTQAVDCLHLLVRRLVEAGEDPIAWTQRCVEAYPDIVFISDEIGCGVVPMGREEREWREAAGRTCCFLARRAERVERLCCGLATLLKQNKPES